MAVDTEDRTSTEAMLAELNELCRDVSDDAETRARRLLLLRRIERRMGSRDEIAPLALG